MVDRLILTRKVWQGMQRHVRSRSPLEACGLLAGKQGRAEIRLGIHNEERSARRFRMEPRAMWRAFQTIEAARMELTGIYHSHPGGPDHPSAADIAETMYPVAQVIWSRGSGRWRGRAYRIEGGKAVEIPVEFLPAE
jgi:proteasome lid subunit RPN8/RPN11